MEPRPKSSSARVLAPIALAVCAVAVLVVIVSTAGGGGDSASTAVRESSSTGTSKTETAARKTPQRSTYTVKTGDTLGAIAVETGVPVETLQELNPALDPQALATGQKIKLVQ
jgi:LysM repeat protein